MLKKIYLKLLMSLLLVALAAPQSKAETLTVADGTSTQDLGPIYSGKSTGFSNGTGYVEILYPKSLLTKSDNDMTGANITGLTYYSNQFGFSGGTIEVQICETANVNLNSEISETPTTIATFTNVQNYYSNGMLSLNFGSNPFTYSGEKNLLVRINVTTKGSKDGRSKYYCNTTYNELGSSTTVIKTTYTVDNGYGNTGWLPKTTFTYEEAIVEPYAAKVNPESIAFGSFPVGSAATTQNVTLKNTGSNPFTPNVSINDGALNSIFSTTYVGQSIAAGETVTIPVTFNPATAGSFTGTMTIDCGLAGTYTVSLSGSAALEKTVADGNVTDAHLPVWGYNYDGVQTNQMIYPASMLTDLVGKKLKGMTFYFTCDSYGKTIFYGGSVKFSLANTSVESFSSTSRITDGLVQVASVVPENGTTEKWVITFDDNADFVYTGGNLLLDVVTTAGTWADTEFYGEKGHTNASYTNRASSLLDFLPKVTFAYEDSETPATPVITVDPATVDAFSTEVGTPVSKTVTVTGENLTDAITATVSGTNASYFTAALIGSELNITYNPTEAGENHTATLTLSSTGAQDVTIALTGTATVVATPTITVNPATLNINATVGETKTATFTATGTDLTGDITVAASEGFTVSPTTISAADAANGATVTVSFTPSAAGSKTGTITLTSDGAESKTVNINATATEAGDEVFTVDKESLDFGTVLLGQNKKLAIKITNNTNENINPVFTFNNNVFSVEDDSYPVYGGASQTYNIVYTPAAAGTDNGTVTISVGRNSVVVNLTGNCVEQAAYDITSSAASGVHNFGDAFVGGFATWNVTLTNKGANAVTPVIEWPANVEGFSAENVPTTISAGQSATITFKFAPTAIKAYGPTSIVVKFDETTAFQFDYTFRGNGIENTGTLPPSTFDNYSYTWTDKDGNEHTSKVSEIATEPEQMIALLREVYTNKNFPGPYYRGYDESGNPETGYPVPYPAIGTMTRFGEFGVTENYTFNDAYGWGFTHDEVNYPSELLLHNSGSHNYYKGLNGNEYKPNEEGLTLLLVEMKDGANSNTVSRTISSSNTLVNIFDKMFKSVRVITNSKKVTKNGVEGTLFKIDCDKMNRFFFLGKGRLRLQGENDADGGLLGRSNYFIDKDNSTTSTGSISNVANDGAPFFEMFEQFSPVSLIEGTESSDVYQELINMQSYAVEHDCVYIPWAPAQVSGGEAGHEFNMYGKSSISEDCQDVRDLMFFVPDQRMKKWDSRDRGANDKFVNYYDDGGYAPNMGLYVIRQNEITGEKIDGQNTYQLHLSWQSNLTDFVPAANGQYTIYLVNADGTYTEVATVPSSQTTYDLTVNMAQHGQQVTYVIQGQDNTGFLSLQFSNEESFIIPGLDENEKFQMMPGAEYYSRFDPQTVQNFYANGMQVMAYPDAATSEYAGQTFNFYRKAAGDADWTLVGTAQVNTAGTEATVSMVESTQRAQSEYKFGYKQNPATVAVTTDAKGNKVFGVIFDNFKANVSTNEHPSSYSYKMEVANTSLHSNEISIKVYKTQMRNLTGTFTEEYVENDEVRQDVDNSRQFDIDVEHSSKTDILRYGAYRWNSSYGTSSNPFAILNLNSTEEEDISPQGQASNQGEFYSVYMNGDSYIGDDVYVAQGETGQATFVDDVPATTNAAEEYTYVPVIETFTGRADYNTYGAPMQTTATGKIQVTVENAGKSGYTWEANGNTYRYYNVFVDVNTLDLPEGYEVAKVRAWRKIDASYLNEKLEAYAYRAKLDANGEFMFDDPTKVPDNDKLGSEPLEGSSAQNEMYRGTFGALDVENGATVPMKFFVRIYFKKSNGSKAAGDEYYITEVEVDGELNNQIPTSIFGVQSYKVVTGIKYYNMAGVESDVPFNGVNIEVTTYDDGSRSTRKIMK